LPQRQNTVDINDLQQVLDFLVDTKMVSRTVLLDGRMLYTSKEKDLKRKWAGKERRHG